MRWSMPPARRSGSSSEGQAHDGKSAQDMIGKLCKGQILTADRAYATPSAKPWPIQGHGPKIRPMPNRVNLSAFSPFLYRYRNHVERFFNKIKHTRAIATRYE
ncbi:transposase (plasmid) [Microvirga sp. VF16]|nr:transposase [Microvirga sp. VF16]QRM33100.1 transposase [Microvirga sp. VF16]